MILVADPSSMPIPEKITLRLGHLAGPLGDWCDKHNHTASEAVRIAVAKMLGVDLPEMNPGNPNASRDTAIAANKARWKGKHEDNQ